jgi:hypothetical protein
MAKIMEEIIEKVSSLFSTLYQRDSKVIGIIQESEGWRVRVEIIEEDEYMQKRAKKDLLGIYEIYINKDLEILSYERIELKERGMV